MSLELLMLGNVAVAQMVEQAKLAEASGYDTLWVADERFYPVFEVARKFDKPVLLHPARRPDMPDLPGEKMSTFTTICSTTRPATPPRALISATASAEPLSICCPSSPASAMR